MDLHPELLHQQKDLEDLKSKICEEMQECYKQLEGDGILPPETAEGMKFCRGKIWAYKKALEFLGVDVKLSVTEEGVI